jgi:hypothetical protein
MPGEAEAPEVGAFRVMDNIFLSGMSLFWPPILLSSAWCPSAYRATCPTLFCSLALISIVQTAYQFVMLLIHALPLPQETSISLHQLLNAFHAVSQKSLLSQDYAPIILSGIIQSHQEAITTKVEVGFPYKIKEGDKSSLMIAIGPNVTVNTILGLHFMLGTGMILDLIDKLAEDKHLNCPPFPIEYRQTSNHVPVMDKQSAAIHHASVLQDLINEIEHLEHYYEAKVQAISTLSINLQHPAVHFGLKSGARASIDDSDSVASALCPTGGMKHWWVPPSLVHVDDDDYHSSVLGENGYL